MKHLLICLTILSTGCSTLPNYYVRRPWVRSFSSGEVIDSKAAIQTQVDGTVNSILGSTEPLSLALKQKMNFFLKRRGFSVTDSLRSYRMVLSYRTSKTIDNAPLDGVKHSYTINGQLQEKLGLVARIDRSTMSETSLPFLHTIALELFSHKELIWKGEAVWQSDDLDILEDVGGSLQALLSELSTGTVRPEVQAVKETHYMNYYKIHCELIPFSSPALPHPVYFEHPSYGPQPTLPRKIRDPYAFEAFVDLIQTADLALPTGDKRESRNVLTPRLWTKITLGGQYRIVPEGKNINVLITMHSTKRGYIIDECKVVDDAAFEPFTLQMLDWRSIVAQYFDYAKTQ